MRGKLQRTWTSSPDLSVTQPQPNTLYAGTQGGGCILMGAEHPQLPLAPMYQAAWRCRHPPLQRASPKPLAGDSFTGDRGDAQAKAPSLPASRGTDMSVPVFSRGWMGFGWWDLCQPCARSGEPTGQPGRTRQAAALQGCRAILQGDLVFPGPSCPPAQGLQGLLGRGDTVASGAHPLLGTAATQGRPRVRGKKGCRTRLPPLPGRLSPRKVSAPLGGQHKHRGLRQDRWQAVTAHQGTARAGRVSGAIVGGRCSQEPKGSTDALGEGISNQARLPGSLHPPMLTPSLAGGTQGQRGSRCTPRPRGQGSQVALGDAPQGARCPFPMSLAPSRGKGVITSPVPKAIIPFPQSPAEQDGWGCTTTPAGDPGRAEQDGLAQDRTGQDRQLAAWGRGPPHPSFTSWASPTVSHHPAAPVPQVASKGSLKPGLDPAQRMAQGALKMNPWHLGVATLSLPSRRGKGQLSH